jgi:hypothetical protein
MSSSYMPKARAQKERGPELLANGHDALYRATLR